MLTLTTQRWLLCLSISLAALLGGISSIWGMNHDQAIFFQAGLREISGQAIYRDYFVPQGPVAGFVFSLFLKLFPTGGWSMVAASATLNAAATLAVWGILFSVLESPIYLFVGSLITAVWFLPIFGMFYNDHLAYFFVLLAFWCHLKAPKLLFSLGLSAFFFAASYHTKQSVGLMALLSLGVAEILQRRPGFNRKSIFFFLSFTFLSHLLMLHHFHALSHLKNYTLYSILCPLWYAGAAKSPWRLLTSLIMPWNINPWAMVRELGAGRWAFYPLILVFYTSYVVWVKNRIRGDRVAQNFVLLFASLSTLWCASLLGRYHGQLFFGTGIVLSLVAFELKLPPWLSLSFFSVLGFINIWTGRGIFAHPDPYFAQSDLFPIRIESSPLSEATAGVVSYLKDKEGKIATIGTRTFLVSPALGRASLSSSLYYQRLLTIPWKHPERETWAQQLIHSLEQDSVKYVVLDTGWRISYEKSLPELMTYLDQNYTPQMNAAWLQILERRS